MWRAALVALAWMILAPAPAVAADAEPIDTFRIEAGVSSLVGDVDWTFTPIHVGRAESPGAVLPSLYAGLAAFNALDAYITSKASAAGASEANPLMRGVVGNAAALWAIKGAATAGSILFAERLRRHHHRTAAIAAMVITNGLMAGVAVNNFRTVNSR